MTEQEKLKPTIAENASSTNAYYTTEADTAIQSDPPIIDVPMSGTL